MFRVSRRSAVIALVLAACGGDSGTDPKPEPPGPTFVNVSGTYSLALVDGSPLPAVVGWEACGADSVAVRLTAATLDVLDTVPDPASPDGLRLRVAHSRDACDGVIVGGSGRRHGTYLATEDSLRIIAFESRPGVTFHLWSGAWASSRSEIAAPMWVQADTFAATFRR